MLRIPLACLLALVLLAQVSRGQLDADFSATPTSGPNPLTVSFTDTTTGGTASAWVWHFGDGAFSFSLLQNPTHEYAGPGTYTVSLSVYDAGGLQDTEVKQDFITVDPAPLVAAFSASPTQGANPLTVAFSDTSTGATTTAWSWDFGDGNTSTAQNPTHQYTGPGSYTVSLTVFVGQQSDTLVKPALIAVEAPGPVQTLVIFENGEVHPDFVFSINECCGPIYSEPGTQYPNSVYSEIILTRTDGGTFNAVSLDVLDYSLVQGSFVLSSSAGGFLELWDGIGTVLLDGPEWDAITSLSIHGEVNPGNPVVLYTDNYVVEVPAECFLVMGNDLGGDVFTPGDFAFGTGLSQIQASYPVLMDDYPTFTLPTLGALGQGMTSSGPGNSTSGSFGYPDWIGPDGVFTAQVMMWSPAQVPGNPEQYSSVLTGWIAPDGSVHVRSHGSGDIDLTLETGVNANGETTFSFPFAVGM
ncbi:MAG: hypothetical protein DRQ55_08965 [Planctomycetota bacterium]|nr:MAG: hypothetical protein DRQ55_08965 [Planctomycetota bacterium]